MSLISFDTHQAQAERLRLHSPHDHLQVQALKNGVWRVLVYHRHLDARKPTWVVQDRQPQALHLETSASGLILSQAAGPDLSLQQDPFQFEWHGLKSVSLISEPVQTHFQELPLPEGDPHIFNGHPVRDLLDGLAFGAGLTLSFAMQAEDHFYGLGERTGFLNKRGQRWHNWTTDQFFHMPKADPLYQAHPFVILQRNGQYCGVYLDESWYSNFDLGFSHQQRWSIHSAGPTLDVYLLPGPDPESVLQRYLELTGKPSLPPLWALGAHQCRWSYPEQETVLDIAQQYREQQLPLDAIWLDIDYMDSYKVFTFSSHRFPEPFELTQTLAGMGLKTVLIVDPGVKMEAGYSVYEEGHAMGAFVRNIRDDELVGEVWPKPVVWPDFVQPAVQTWWGKLHQFYLDQGIAGIWNDMNEPAAFKWPGKTLPLDARQGRFSHAEVHNLYGLLMAKATFEGLTGLQPERRPFILTRSGFPGIQRYAWTWTGDNASFWEHLEGSIPMILNLGLSGVPFSGADIGGFSSHCDGELLACWTWLGVCYPFMRNHAGKRSRRQEPWQFGEPWLSTCREALNFRYQLLPYLYSLSVQAVADGLPLMRPLLLDFPDDPETWQLNDQFLLGKDLLAAPVLRPGQTRRLVYFPAGDWYCIWTGQKYSGQNWEVIPVSFERLPLFQRAGTAIPLQPVQQHTDTAWWPELNWQIAPAAHVSGQVYADAGEGYADGHWQTLTANFDATNWQIAVHDTHTTDSTAPEQIAKRRHSVLILGNQYLPHAAQQVQQGGIITLSSDQETGEIKA